MVCCRLGCKDDEVVCENFNFQCMPKSRFVVCTDGQYKGMCISRTQICDNFNVCGGRSLQPECCELLFVSRL